MDQVGRKQLPHGPSPWSRALSGETYFLTLCVQNRTEHPLIKNEVAGRLLQAVRFYNEKSKWWTSLAMVMPDHLHLLTTFPEELAPTVRAWKHWTARYIGIRWQRDFFDHRLRRDEKYNETAEYVLHNPVRAGLVDDWQKWPHVWMAAGPE
jgi:REP element-mobilizing transposase RayT